MNIKFALFILVAIIFPAMAYAAAPVPTQMRMQIVDLPELDSNSSLSESVDVDASPGEEEASPAEKNSGATHEARGAIAPMAAAPGLSYLQIHHVKSQSYPYQWEFVPVSTLRTVNDHGGSWLRVATVEVGYGSHPIGRMNGAVLPASANYQTVPFCTSNYALPCSPGQTVIGFVRYWNLDGYQNGIFSYQNTSTNYPYKTLSDRLTIL